MKFFLRHPHSLSLACLFLLVFAVFGPSLRNDFVWDDHGLILGNENLQTGGKWHHALWSNFWQIGKNTMDPSRSFYRPLITLSYFLDHRVWGFRPAGYHLSNILAHAICTGLVYGLGILLTRRPILALAGAALFAVHPTRVENVAWISGRTDIYCAVFYFAGFFLFLRALTATRHTGLLWTGVIACYACALLGKEMALTFPILLAFYYLLIERKNIPWHRLVAPAFALAGVTLAYILLRMIILGEFTTDPTYGNGWQRAASIPVIFAKYIGLMFHLVRVDPHHHNGLVESLPDYRLWTGIFVSTGYAVILLKLWKSRNRLLLFLLGWFPLTLIPVFRLGTFGDILYADRFLYIPSFGILFGILLLITCVMDHAGRSSPRMRKLAAAGYGIFLATSMGLSLSHASYWRNNLALFKYAASTSPQSAYIQFNLGNSLAGSGNDPAAVQAYLKAIGLEPKYTEALTNLGVVLARLGAQDKAMSCFQKTLELNGHDYLAHAHIANIWRARGNLDLARFHYRQSLAIRETAVSHNNLGECLMAGGHLDEAEKHFLAALQLHPESGVLNNLGMLYLERGDYGQAIRFLVEALGSPVEELSFEYKAKLHGNLSRALFKDQNVSAAAPHARKAIEFISAGSPTNVPDTEAAVREMNDIIQSAENPDVHPTSQP